MPDCTNHVFVPPRFVWRSDDALLQEGDYAPYRRTVADEFKHHGTLVRDVDVHAAHEMYLRLFLSRCATRINLPAAPAEIGTSPRWSSQALTPTLRKRVRFLDANDTIWQAVASYLSPVLEDLANSEHSTLLIGSINGLAWATYRLILAWSSRSEVSLLPSFVAGEIYV